MSLLDGFGNLLISSAVGAATSWALSEYYFRRATRAELIADQIKLGLQTLLFPTLHPQFFDPKRGRRVRPNEDPPDDHDIPFVEYAIFNPCLIGPSQCMEVLLKLKDSGFDLDNPGGVVVHDSEGKSLDVTAFGLGFAKVSLTAPPTTGKSQISVFLTDSGERKRVSNRNHQTISYTVEGGLP